MNKLLHTRSSLVSWLCCIGGLCVVLMLSSAIYFLALTLLTNDAHKLLKLYGSMVWTFFWMYMYWRWMQRHTSWLQNLDNNEKKENTL